MSLTSQPHRRLLVIVSALMLITLLIPGLHNALSAILIVILNTLIVALLHRSVGHLWRESDQDLDERERAFKFHIYRYSYRIITALAILSVMLVIVLNPLIAQAEDPSSLFKTLGIAFLIVLFTLPSYLIAWLEADDTEP